MKRLLLTGAGFFVALTATVTIAAPAAAIDRPGLSQASSAHGVTIHRRGDRSSRNFRHGDRRDRGSDGGIYYGDREYQGDTAWRPTGFNDWWHERPWRSEPRWLRTNNCERVYWTGGGWRC